MAGLGNTGINGFLSSAKLTGQKIIKRGKEIPEMVEHFLSGFAGYGWKIWEHRKGKYKLEIDDLNVRGTMTVYELLIQKIRAVIGALAITQGQGKIKSVALSPDQSEYLIQVEEDMSFREYDFIRCQTWTGNVKMYHVKIDRISDNKIIHIPIEEFDTDYDEFDQLIIHNAPAIGDDIIQFGNEVYEDRQSAIYLHVDESGQPAIDIMFGINSKDWTNCVKGRLGGDIPGGDGAKGMYFENGMIKGTDETGHTVYCIYPNGDAMFGDGSAMFNSDRSGQLAGGAIQWHFNDDKGRFELILGEDVIMSWDNLDNTTKEMLTPKIGENGNWWIGGKDTGQKAEGEDGTSPYIGENGNWWFGTTDTGVKAKANDGKSPYIGTNGNWFIWDVTQNKFVDSGDTSVGDDGKSPEIRDGYWWAWDGEKWYNTGVKARGTDGKDSKSDEFIFILNNNPDFGIEDNTPTSIQQDDYVPTNWTDDPVGVDSDNKYEWVSTRKFRDEAWGTFSTPSIWNIYVTDGEDGKDSKSDEFIFIRNNNPNFGIADNRPETNQADDYVPPGWTDDPTGVTPSEKYEWVCKRIFRNDSWSEFSIPSLWAKWSEDANLLDWVNEWNNNRTLIGAEYVVSPKTFSGTRGTDGKLTGIAMGRDCIEIDGVKRTGIFALVDDEIVFELDPISKKYKFTGEIQATSGALDSIIVTNADIKDATIEGATISGVLSQIFVDVEDAKYIDNSKTLSVRENSSLYCKSPGKTSVALPTELSYNGFRVCVYNTGTSYKVSGSETWVNTEIEITTNGKSRLCRSVRRDGEGQIHREFSDKFIVELGCYVEFVACPNRSVFGGTEQIDIVWMINEVIQVKG